MRFQNLPNVCIAVILLWGASCFAESPLQVPSFLTSVPPNHFAGVSSPCDSISEARRSAIDEVVRQILSSVNVQYNHSYSNRVSGNVRGKVPKRVVDDRLSKVAKGVVLGVERNIAKSSWSLDGSGMYVYFILVQYQDKLIAEMRRLSRGAKVVASIVSDSGDSAKVRVTEVNGVSAVLSSADVIIRKRNRFAKLISYYVVHVSKGSEQKMTVAVDPVWICSNSREFRLALSDCKKKLSDYLLGAEVERVAVLKGHDEIGRKVSVTVVF
ncbi:hypothetical protein ACFL03_07810 [Thermodesulfobacteriota bacterium]